MIDKMRPSMTPETALEQAEMTMRQFFRAALAEVNEQWTGVECAPEDAAKVDIAKLQAAAELARVAQADYTQASIASGLYSMRDAIAELNRGMENISDAVHTSVAAN